MDRLVCRKYRPMAFGALLFSAVAGASLVVPASASAMTVDQHIKMLQAQIKPGQAAGHVALAQYEYSQHLYSRALTQVDAALAISPHNQNALLLKSLITAAIQNGGASTGPKVKHPGKSAGGLLTAADINSIRLAEWSTSEVRPMRGIILKRVKTLHAFWKKWIAPNPQYQSMDLTKQDYAQFSRLNNFARQAALIMRFGDPKFTKMIVLRNNPDAIRVFRTTIQPFVLQSCSTVGCHRGQDFHGFKMFGAKSTPSLTQTYTNFYILSKYTYHGRKLIDRSNPYNSLLIQYLLPPKIAAEVHPGKKPLPYRSFNEKSVISWISSLALPTPTYGINYKMPVSKAASH
jgi:hypothetical protein